MYIRRLIEMHTVTLLVFLGGEELRDTTDGNARKKFVIIACCTLAKVFKNY